MSSCSFSPLSGATFISQHQRSLPVRVAMPSVFDPFRGVKVEVVSQGRSLDLYDDPEADQIVEGSNPEADQVAEGSDAEADQVAEENKAYYRTLYVEGQCGAGRAGEWKVVDMIGSC